MPEPDAIERSRRGPVSVDMLVDDLQRLGVRAGMVLLVHSSLSSLGWVCGGPVAVVQALDEALGPEGTLVVPTHSSDLSDPAGWGAPAVPQTWWGEIGAAFAAACAEGVRAGEVGHAVALLVRQRALVDFAVEWMPGHRRGAAR